MLSRPDFEKKQILFVFCEEGQKISFKNDNIVVKDADGKVAHQSTCYRIHLLCIVGNTSITTGLLQRASKFKFTICLMTNSLKVCQVIGKRLEGNTLLHRRQYEYSGMELGRRIVSNKLMSQFAALDKLRLNDDSAFATKASIRGYIEKMENEEGLDRETLLAYEGNAAREYFGIMFRGFDWKGRKPRIKADYINATLDIGYTVLFNFVESLLDIYDFDLYCGVLHTEFYMRKSLVCDLMEPLRPIIDAALRKGINLGQICEEDFRVENHRHVLSWDKSKKYTRIFLGAIMDRKSDIFLYIQSYYRMFMKGADTEKYKEFVL